MIEVIAIDDSTIDLYKLEAIFSKIENAKLIGTFEDGQTALTFAEKSKPDVAIVDIEMPGMDGFETGMKLSALGIAIVFLTSHPQHALKAFDYAALHYLVKPAKPEVIIEAVNRFSAYKKENILDKQTVTAEQIKFAKEGIQLEGAFQKGNKIFINTIGEVLILSLSDIMYLSSEGNYSVIKCFPNERIISSKTLKTYETILSNCNEFMRVHRSYIINRKYVKSLKRERTNNLLVLTDGTEIEIGVNKKNECLNWLMEVNG